MVSVINMAIKETKPAEFLIIHSKCLIYGPPLQNMYIFPYIVQYLGCFLSMTLMLAMQLANHIKWLCLRVNPMHLYSESFFSFKLFPNLLCYVKETFVFTEPEVFYFSSLCVSSHLIWTQMTNSGMEEILHSPHQCGLQARCAGMYSSIPSRLRRFCTPRLRCACYS